MFTSAASFKSRRKCPEFWLIITLKSELLWCEDAFPVGLTWWRCSLCNRHCPLFLSSKRLEQRHGFIPNSQRFCACFDITFWFFFGVNLPTDHVWSENQYINEISFANTCSFIFVIILGRIPAWFHSITRMFSFIVAKVKAPEAVLSGFSNAEGKVSDKVWCYIIFTLVWVKDQIRLC